MRNTASDHDAGRPNDGARLRRLARWGAVAAGLVALPGLVGALPVPVVAPAVPQGVRAVAEPDFAALTWTAGGPLDVSYLVFFRDHPEDAWQVVAETTATHVRVWVRHDPPESDEFAVQALGAGGASPLSAPARTEFPAPFVDITSPDGGTTDAACYLRLEGRCLPLGSVTQIPWCLPWLVGAAELACDQMPAVVVGDLNVVAQAYSPAGIDHVEFRINGQVRHVASAPSWAGTNYYSWTWATTDPATTNMALNLLEVEAVDAAGRVAADHQEVLFVQPVRATCDPAPVVSGCVL